MVCRCAPNESTRGRLESTRLIILRPFSVPPFWTGDRRCRVWRLCIVARYPCIPIRSIVVRISLHALHCRRTRLRRLRLILPNQETFSMFPAKVNDEHICLYSSTTLLFNWHSIHKLRRFHEMNLFHQSLPHKFQIVFLLCHLVAVQRTRIERVLVADEHRDVPKRTLSPIGFEQDLLHMPLPDQSCHEVSENFPFRKNNMVLNVLPRFWPLVPWCSNPDSWAFRLRKFQPFRSVLHLDLGAVADTAPLAFPCIPRHFVIVSRNFAAAICGLSSLAMLANLRPCSRFVNCGFSGPDFS